jgi:hypothetical protein
MKIAIMILAVLIGSTAFAQSQDKKDYPLQVQIINKMDTIWGVMRPVVTIDGVSYDAKVEKHPNDNRLEAGTYSARLQKGSGSHDSGNLLFVYSERSDGTVKIVKLNVGKVTSYAAASSHPTVQP